ncbi:MAG: 2-aminoethylphosphonate--pyruvate transaminase [Armatimonadia bacterium]|nr:2-aminoethylphosphonate--pyruvate transaminase [Armatimonadia bacterium]
MTRSHGAPHWRDKALFTPGPLTTSRTVKQAMLRDLGSRDAEFISVVADVRRRLLNIAGADPEAYTAIPMQGSGTFGLEAVLSSAVPRDGKVLVLVNGAYGRRLAEMATVLGIGVSTLEWPENRPAEPAEVQKALAGDSSISHVILVHCETTSGLMNPVEEVGRIVADAGRTYFVDAMSSFGAVPLSMPESRIDYLVSSANKCIEGVPGFSFAIARLEPLLACEGVARSLSLDLLAQHRGLESNGQFRFTPPTHSILAFHQALLELEAEGGVEGRMRRYQANHRLLLEGMRAMGFREYVDVDHQGWIITTFHYPDDPSFDFDRFYDHLSSGGHVIYPGKVGTADCFRIGSIGRLDAADMRGLLSAIDDALKAMGVSLAPAKGTLKAGLD